MRRILIWAGIGIIIALIIWLAWRQTLRPTPQKLLAILPVDVQRLIPPAWDTTTGITCDFDGDRQDEWLVIYRYDRTELPQPGKTAKAAVEPYGAVIYDARFDPQGKGSQLSTTTITPYRLLPDFSKGQGFLGEAGVELVSPSPVPNRPCQATEIVFLGYSDSARTLPTRLSIFRWQEGTGYPTAHFVGSARVAAEIPENEPQRIAQVTTYDRLNDRSLLCEARGYVRRDDPSGLSFREEPSAYTIDFCFDAPADPTYPEGAIVAMLRGHAPSQKATPVPPGKSYLMPDVALPDEIRPPVSIRAVVNPAVAVPAPVSGIRCQHYYGDEGEGWWCGRLQAEVTTELLVGGAVRPVTWKLVSVARSDVVDDVHWRVRAIVP